ncbi:MAG: hypothetical protein ACRC0L_11845 [Angustibacter sp.]
MAQKRGAAVLAVAPLVVRCELGDNWLAVFAELNMTTYARVIFA